MKTEANSLLRTDLLVWVWDSNVQRCLSIELKRGSIGNQDKFFDNVSQDLDKVWLGSIDKSVVPCRAINIIACVNNKIDDLLHAETRGQWQDVAQVERKILTEPETQNYFNGAVTFWTAKRDFIF